MPKFFEFIDLNNQELRNFLVQNLASRPGGAEGRLILNTQTGAFEGYVGGQWVSLSVTELIELGSTGATVGQIPEADGTGGITWANPPQGVTDHGALFGLGDDDHTQYALADGTRGNFEPTGTASAEVAAHEGAADPHSQYLTQAETDALYAVLGHGHTTADISDFTEASQDVVGGMVSTNTETLITVTYDDVSGKLNFVVTDDLSQYDNATSDFQSGAQVSSAISATVTKAFVDALNVDADTLDGLDSTAFAPAAHTHAYATESYVDTQINSLVDAAPGTLDTLNELAAALGDDPNFATTVTNQLNAKPDKFVASVGDGAATSIAVTHNLGTRDVQVQVYDNATYETVFCGVVRNTTNQVTLNFGAAPALNAFRVVVTG